MHGVGMKEPSTEVRSRESASRYLTRVVDCPAIQPAGLHHLEPDGGSALLPWDRVVLVVAAEIGEPEGVRTIVFDVIAETGEDVWLAHRMDAEPGSASMDLARELTARLTSDACGPSLKSLAADGIPSRWYPDLASFEEDTIALLTRSPG